MQKNLKEILSHILFKNEISGGDEDKDLEKCYQKALSYACGKDFKNEKQEYLQSIFSELAENKSQEKYFFEPKTLSISDFNFPKNTKIESNYNAFSEFENEYKDIKNFENRAFADTCLALLEKYFSYTPCQIEGLEDVSLYDHIKSVMGLMVCLGENQKNENKPFLLIKGDLSGIQKFIYSNINSTEAGETKGAAKKLRGKSFYIALLSDFFAEEIIANLNLSNANIIFSGGGHFNIVAPNTSEIKEKLKTLEEKLNKILLDKVATNLSLNLAFVECGNDLYQETDGVFNTGKYFYEVNQILDKNKNQKYKSYLKTIFNNFGKKQHLQDFENLGTFLPYSDYIVQIKFDVKTSFDNKNLVVSFAELNTYFFMFKDGTNIKEDSLILDFLIKNQDAIKEVKITKKNDFENFLAFSVLQEKFNFPISFTSKFVGNYAPFSQKSRNERVSNFEEISKLDYQLKQDLSYPQLAIMRLDVDNLGGIFAFGLGKKSTFVRVATLSRALSVFFSGYMNTLAKEYEVYITYSGGDDAFIIGSWFNIIHFAKELHQKFKEFTCQNEGLAFSAGVFMCHENYPVPKFAKDAEDAEKLAKNFKRIEKEKEISKNAICIFDHALNWESYKKQIEFAEDVLELIENEATPDQNKDKLARSFIHRLLRIIKSCMDKKGNIITQKFNRNIAQLHYLFARQGYNNEKLENAEKKENPTEITDKIAKIVIKKLLTNFSNQTSIKDDLIALHYILLKTRKL